MARAIGRDIGRAPDRHGQALSDADYGALAEFRYALRRFLNRSAAAARAARLTPQQHQALLAIKGHTCGAISIGGLAEKLMVRHHSAGELVERLRQAGLVERQPDPADRRRVLIFVSTRGHGLLAALSTVHLEEVRLIQPALRRLLAKLDAG